MKITLVNSSILNCNTEAIVNPANPQLLKGGGLSGIIHEAAGDELFQYLKKWKRENNIPFIEHGTAMISPSFNLPFKFIIHAVGAVWTSGSDAEKEMLHICYKACLDLAEQHQLSSIAFPNISTGIYGFPKDIAAKIAIETVQSYDSNFLMEAVFACYDQENYDLYKSMLS